MAFLISRRRVYPDGSYDGLVYVNSPIDGSWRTFGIDGFIKFIAAHNAECWSSFRLSDDFKHDGFEYDVYSLSFNAYRFALEILS